MDVRGEDFIIVIFCFINFIDIRDIDNCYVPLLVLIALGYNTIQDALP